MRPRGWLLGLLLLLAACGGAGADGTPDDAAPDGTAPPTPAVQSPPGSGESTSQESSPVTIRESAEPPSNLARIAASWETDWSRTTIDLDDLLSGGPPRDGIPPIDDPKFYTMDEAAELFDPVEPVVAIDHDGTARAYPLQILMWHEVVNDEIDGWPITVTFCPLCNSAIAFDRRFEGQVLDFGVSGLLRNSDLVMWDRQTETLWQQVTGEGIVGEYAGRQLTLVPVSIISFGEFQQAYPEGDVLSRDTGQRRSYGANPYENYDSSSRPFLYRGELDERLPALARVVGITLPNAVAAYSFAAIAEAGAINDDLAGQPVAILFTPDTASALDAGRIANGRAVGSAVPFDPVVDGQRLTFERRDGMLIDRETESEWDISGRATAGPLAGSKMTVLPHANHFWFAFAAFYPGVELRTDGGTSNRPALDRRLAARTLPPARAARPEDLH